MLIQEKTIEDIPVAYVAKQGHPSAVASKAFWELEQKVSFKGNKFYGVFDENKNEYRACVAINKTNQDALSGLAHGTISGGLYVYTVLKGEYNYIVRQVGPTFTTLTEKYTKDISRPSIEFYTRHTEVIVMLPINK